MILRLASGSSTPSSLPRKRSAASIPRSAGCCSGPEQRDHLLRLARWRSSPWSTKMQVSWSPIASCRQHPRRPSCRRHRTGRGSLLPVPTCARILATASARNAAMVQSPAQPATCRTKLASSFAPCGVCTTSGMELHAVRTGAGRPRPRANGAPSEGADDAEARRQRGHLVAMGHPDLLPRAGFPQTVEQLAPVPHVQEGAAEFPVVVGLHRAAQLRHHGLLAIADAQQRERPSRTPAAARAGWCSSVTEAGPPERITALGRNARTLSSSAALNGQISQ